MAKAEGELDCDTDGDGGAESRGLVNNKRECHCSTDVPPGDTVLLSQFRASSYIDGEWFGTLMSAFNASWGCSRSCWPLPTAVQHVRELGFRTLT